MSSGLWPGYWSRSCEEWFQNCHQAIVEHRATLKSALEWKKSMKLQRLVGKLRDSNTNVASKYLNSAAAVALY